MTLMKVCFGCKNPINDMYYLMVGNDFYWHISCLKCECCQSKMQNKCYFDDGKFYCLDDYLKIKQQKLMQMQYHQQQIDESKNYCNACKQLFNQNEYILNIQQQQYRYHIGCFVCTECQKQIPPGDQYGILNQLIYCSIHYNIKLNSMNFNDDRLILDRSNNNEFIEENLKIKVENHEQLVCIKQEYDQNNNSNHSKSEPQIPPVTENNLIRKNNNNKFNNLVMMINNNTNNLSSSSSGTINNTNGNSNKKKRIRTSFKHTQLRIMRLHFQINQNPDSKDLKDLSERTGLQKRVLQVWFQNSRAKQRKNSNGSTPPLGSLINNSLSQATTSGSNDDNCDSIDNDESVEMDDDGLESGDEFETDNNEDNIHDQSQDDSNSSFGKIKKSRFHQHHHHLQHQQQKPMQSIHHSTQSYFTCF